MYLPTYLLYIYCLLSVCHLFFISFFLSFWSSHAVQSDFESLGSSNPPALVLLVTFFFSFNLVLWFSISYSRGWPQTNYVAKVTLDSWSSPSTLQGLGPCGAYPFIYFCLYIALFLLFENSIHKCSVFWSNPSSLPLLHIPHFPPNFMYSFSYVHMVTLKIGVFFFWLNILQVFPRNF